jgi:peptidoglycan/xylan/chitin deacetylase (PgdA/CDA1 family)
MYHSIAEVRNDPWGLCVTPQHFAEHLDVLRRYYRPLRLTQYVDALDDGGLPDRSVVVTFDDGYADNLFEAKPLLEQFDVPATMFVATRYVGSPQEYWWDELARLLLETSRLPEELNILIDGHVHHWKLGDAAVDESTSTRSNDWRAWDEPLSSRHSLYRSLWQLLQLMREDDQQATLDTLRTWAAYKATQSTHCPLSQHELFMLSQARLVEIGAHTVTHPLLSTRSASEQWQEIHGSITWLAEIVAKPVAHFSYPYGNFGHDTLAIVQEVGLKCACSVSASEVQLPAGRFQVPRVQVFDCDGEEFDRRLSRHFNG